PSSGAEAPHPLVGRLARLELNGTGGEPIASVGAVEILATPDLDSTAVEERLTEHRRGLEAEVARAEGKLANEGFVANAPNDVVEAERGKLDRYRAELAELSG
ncbi:MAG: valine--tRNA ligase, partial [Solirubrobacterales bacterium]|nr:valine--tRNA ligase [Solirubrobacterales bacterium]